MPVPQGYYQPYDNRCREYRDMGRAYYIPCEVRGSQSQIPHVHQGRTGTGSRTVTTWNTGVEQCSDLNPEGWRCQLAKGHGTYHRAIAWGGDVYNFGTPAHDYVARLASDNLNALASNTIVGPCLDRRMLEPGYAIQCVLSKNHGHPHMIRFGSIVQTWGDETQCPALHPTHPLRCLNGNGHAGLHFSVYDGYYGVHWADAGLLDDETAREVREQRTLLESASRPRTYAERKARRR